MEAFERRQVASGRRHRHRFRRPARCRAAVGAVPSHVRRQRVGAARSLSSDVCVSGEPERHRHVRQSAIPFNSTQANGEANQLGGNPDLEVEHSQAAQAEINARIFKGEHRIRELSFRIDGSYTRLTNLIQVSTGKYGNIGSRGLASAEFLGKLYLQGGHRIELGYTWLRGDSADRGALLALPEHWFYRATVWSLLPKKLTVTTNVRITGAADDPNRLVEYRGLRYDGNGQPMGTVTSLPITSRTSSTCPIRSKGFVLICRRLSSTELRMGLECPAVRAD